MPFCIFPEILRYPVWSLSISFIQGTFNDWESQTLKLLFSSKCALGINSLFYTCSRITNTDEL